MTEAGRDLLEVVGETEAAIRPALEGQLRDAVESDAAVAAACNSWSRGPGVPGGDDGVYRAAARQANVLTNLVRYRTVLGRTPPDPLCVTPVAPFETLDAPGEVEAALDDLGATLRDRGDVDAALLGARYAGAIVDAERRTRGQFYTPERVADLVVGWALDGDADRPYVLDPAAGTGTFHLASYDRLRERRPDADPDALLSRLVAVDVDEVALHVAALRLSARIGGGPVDAFDRRSGSFFDLEPGEDLPPVDAVVGNPPFVRAGGLSPDREHFRAHLAAYPPAHSSPDADGGSPYLDGDRALSRRCDASVYFVTHATRFLRPGGRLGVVLPAKWLESDYGVGFRRFLADRYRVHAVVGFGSRTFDALVDTVLLLAERREEGGARHERIGTERPVRFVRFDGRPDAIESPVVLRTGLSATDGARAPDDRSRVVELEQTAFAGARQCSPYLRAPAELLPLLDHPSLVPLGELASVSRGVTTGANRFFLLDATDRERWGIHPRFLRPALRSVRGVEARTLTPDRIDRSILDVHGFLSEQGVLDGSGGDPTERAKAALRRSGHDALVEYVEYAEAEGWHEGRTCQSRRVWFDLGALPTPDAFVPKLVRERVFTIRNRAGAVPSNAIDCLSVREGVDRDVLLGVLDSSLCRALMEVWGRDEAGLLQLMTYETRSLPVPDVRAFSAEEAAAVREGAAALEAEVPDPSAPDTDGQTALDEAVVDALDVDLGADRIRRLRERLLGRRVDGGDRVEARVS